MPENEIINTLLKDTDTMHSLQQSFNKSSPFRFVAIDDFLQPAIANILCEHFPSIGTMNTHYKGINEKKAEHSDFNILHPSFEQLHQAVSSKPFIEWLQKITGIESLVTINDRLGYGLHQGANNSFLDIHIDYNLHPIKKLYRKLNFILFLNLKWEKDWGGNLEFWDADVKNCIQSISPVFNRCVIFECSDISYHGYNRLNIPEEVTRKSYYQYFFIPVTDHIAFHDTVFKPRPEEPFTKKLITYTKDFAKNTVKKVLVRLDWKKFLK